MNDFGDVDEDWMMDNRLIKLRTPFCPICVLAARHVGKTIIEGNRCSHVRRRGRIICRQCFRPVFNEAVWSYLHKDEFPTTYIHFPLLQPVPCSGIH